MKKKKLTPLKVKEWKREEDTSLNIDVWWTISKEWMSLPYEVKASFYWKYEFNDKGQRIFPSTDIIEKYN